MAEFSLKQRVIRGGFWVFLARIVSRVFSFLRLIILARLLLPSDFGLMGIALLSLATLETFSETGFSQALIQKKENIKSYLNVAWTILVLRGFILFLILFLIAPYAALFFNAPQAKLIIQIIGLAVLFQALTNIGVVYFQRNLEFNKLFLYELGGILSDFIVAVSIALIWKTVWALVLGFLVGEATRFIISYLIHPWHPKIEFDFKKANELFSFGKWILGSVILVFFLTQGDDIFVGKLLGITALGLYQLAYKISNLPATEITHVISQVTFPVYSKLQDNILKLKEAYLKVLQLTGFLSFPIAGLIFSLGPDFTQIFLGEKWLPMVPAMMALCIFGITRMINATTAQVFQGIGRPRINTIGSAFQLIIMGAIIYPLTNRWGILGTSIAVIIPNILFMVYLSRKLVKTVNFKMIQLVKPLFPAFISVLVMVLLIYFLKSKILMITSLLVLSLLILLGTIIYFVFVWLFDRNFVYELRDNLNYLFNIIKT